MNAPLISICIPVYNGENYLRECLDSAIAQTYSNTEIIVVDDCSNDGSINIVKDYMQADQRIRLYSNEKNLGLVSNWNRCMDLAKGEWIKFIFQDDFMEKNCIERMMAYASENVHFICCNRQFIFESGVDIQLRKQYELFVTSPQKEFNIEQPAFIPAKDICKVVIRNKTSNFIGEPTVVMFRKDLTGTVGKFNTSLLQICDFEYWLRIATQFGMFYIPETLAYFRVHGLSTTSKNRKEQNDLADTLVLADLFLEDKNFKDLRKQAGPVGMLKLKLLFRIRLKELRSWLKNNPGAGLKNQMEAMKSSASFKSKNDPLTGILFYLMMFRRSCIKFTRSWK